jgi:hypothetical protein
MRNLNTGPVWGWAVGGYVDWSLPGDRLCLATEMMYIEKGYSREVVSLHGTLETTESRNQYLSLPFLVTYDLLDGRFTPYVFGGPSAEVLMSEGGTYGQGLWNLGVHLGAGVRWRGLEMHLRYIRDLTEATGGSPSGLRGVENHGIVLAVGVGISRAQRE